MEETKRLLRQAKERRLNERNALVESLAKECHPILTKERALTLIRFLKTDKWREISNSWLDLMQEWLADETLQPSIVPKQSLALNAFKTMMKATRAEHPHEVSLIPEELRHDVAESLGNFVKITVYDPDGFPQNWTVENQGAWDDELRRRALEWLAEMEQDDAGASPHRVEQETQVDSDSD